MEHIVDKDFGIIHYTRIEDITLINFFGFRFFKKVGNVYSIFGIVFGTNECIGC